MGKVIRFPGPPPSETPSGSPSCEKDRENTQKDLDDNQLFPLFSTSLEELKDTLLGTAFAWEKNLRKIEQFYLAILIQRFRNPRQHFPSYMYLSQLLSRSHQLAPGYVVDILKEDREPWYERTRKAGDLCFILSGLFPEWIERRRSVTTRNDYIQLGEHFYRQTASAISGSRAQLFWDLSLHFRPYADVIREAKQALFFS